MTERGGPDEATPRDFCGVYVRIVLAAVLFGGVIVGVQTPAQAADCYSINSGSNGALSFCDTTRHRPVVKCRRAANGAAYSNTGTWAAARTFSNTVYCSSGDTRTGHSHEKYV